MATPPSAAASVPIVVRDVRHGAAVVDLAGSRVIRLLRAVGVETVLLKGPATRFHLYGSEARSYRDVDLLVSPASWSVAVRAIESLGRQQPESWADRLSHSLTWHDPYGIGIDLHRRVAGAEVEDHVGWNVLLACTQTTTVASTCVRIPNRAATLAIVALHAAQHGTEKEKPLLDLARALAVADLDAWREALAIADRLGARESFSAGLRLAPDGVQLCQELELEVPTRATVRLRATSTPYADAIATLRELSPAARRSVLSGLLVPSVEELRNRPSTRVLARRRATIPLAVCVRWLHLGWKLGGAVRPYLRARRFERRASRP